MMRYAVTLFSRDEHGTTMPDMELDAALKLASDVRPALGASYVHDETRRLVFKPYRTPRVTVGGYNGTSRTRLNAVQREAAARRFEADGEHENAAAMRALA